jgi:iron(III) transport system ATP-binding protein
MNGRIVSSPEICIPPFERHIGFVFQSAALWPHKTVAGNILFAMGSLPVKEQEERLSILLNRMGINQLKDRYPDQISGGEARRVALARALAPRPETLLCDEPLANLDHPLRDDLLGLIVETSKLAGSCLIYVTHDEFEATRVADTILRFRNGAIVG